MEVLSAISFLKSGIESVSALIQKSRDEKAVFLELLEEMKQNLKIIRNDYLENSAPPEKIIDVLSIGMLEKAEAARKRKKLDFNRIRKGVIPKIYFVSDEQYRYYADFDTEQLLLKIREKIKELKYKKKLYYSRKGWSKEVNPTRRMNNIANLFILFSRHISRE